jgi:hypothetical protein
MCGQTTESPVRIVGNLPFAVATELLLKWLRQIPEREGPFAHGTLPFFFVLLRSSFFFFFSFCGRP